MHVLDHHGVKAGVLVVSRFCRGLLRDGRDGKGGFRRARERRHVDAADEGTFGPEQGARRVLTVHARLYCSFTFRHQGLDQKLVGVEVPAHVVKGLLV